MESCANFVRMEIFCCANIDADATLTTTIDQLLRRPTAGDIDVLIVVVDVFCARLVKVYIEERDDTTAVSNFIATSVGTYFDSYKYQGIEYVLAREDLWTVDDSSKVTLLTREVIDYSLCLTADLLFGYYSSVLLYFQF